MPLVSFTQFKQQQFIVLAEKIIQQPEQYLHFDSVADVYQARWLDDFPKGTTWQVTGLDNGAETFCLLICYQNCQLSIDYIENGQVKTQLSYPKHELGKL